MKRLAIAALAASLLIAFPGVAASQSRPDLLEVLEIEGEITSNTASNIRANVETINDNPKVKAVLLVVSSPGGGVLASAEVYHALSKLKVPVVGWCNGLCASGGLYALMSPSVKYVGVSAEAISGSVGVIMQVTKFSRLLNWAMIDNTTFKSGELKNAGDPTVPMSEPERKYLQSLTDGFAETFYGVVKAARPAITDWDAIKSARVFIGGAAVRVGLADKVMGKDDALKKAKELSKSESIFTRDELKKMSRAADNHSFAMPVLAPKMSAQPYGDVSWLIELVKEIRNGESVRFSYRLPMAF